MHTACILARKHLNSGDEAYFIKLMKTLKDQTAMHHLISNKRIFLNASLPIVIGITLMDGSRCLNDA